VRGAELGAPDVSVLPSPPLCVLAMRLLLWPVLQVSLVPDHISIPPTIFSVASSPRSAAESPFYQSLSFFLGYLL